MDVYSFNFAASKFYTFNFNTQYEKAYSFTATGRTFKQGDAIATVFSNAGRVIFEDEQTADASLKFAGQLPKEVVHGENITDFAIYPSTSYDRTQDKVTYALPSDGKDGAELYSASLSATSTSVPFNSVSDALATLSFTVPEGVSSVKIVSDMGFVGTAEMTVDSNGKLVSGAGDGKEINLSAVSAQTSISKRAEASITRTSPMVVRTILIRHRITVEFKSDTTSGMLTSGGPLRRIPPLLDSSPARTRPG